MRVVPKVLGLTQRWRKYDQMIMTFFKYNLLDGTLGSSRHIRLVASLWRSSVANKF